MTKHHYMGPLFTDFYELTMAAGYFNQKMMEKATFSVFIRNYAAKRDYFVAAGLEDVLHELQSSCFSENDIRYLQKTAIFSEKFIEYLKTFRFSGEIFAMPEGTIFFPDEPMLEITAPLIETQLFETFILNTLGFQTMIATKAARCIQAADGRPLIDFSLRRTQGTDAGMKVARSTCIAGFQATSNVLAGKIFDIPLSGTMA
ncbi:MAG: nicotinate phosphoribosyltransferase, partial [Deltaproteobacteria bacterium]|nr:nicotinate phosphoribosyltransferase [Deltaproteobacteria bacterium]